MTARRASPDPDLTRFPPDFIWGAATSAYQVEGAVAEDNRGPSIWDTFCGVPGAVEGSDTGEIAAGHYHRWRDDVALMATLGLNGYRFSTSWSRVLPDGVGPVNLAGLDFYDRLVDALLEAGITPCVTLNHWDIPEALQARGGWASRTILDAFVRYADVVTRRLGDRVRLWFTQNEPWVIAFLGYYYGQHAPGLHDAGQALQVAHHLLVSHGQAVPVIRANARNAEVGIVNVHFPNRPASTSEADHVAAARADLLDNRWFLDALLRGHYPAEALDWYGPHAPVIDPGDMATIAAPLDVLGVNYYYQRVIAADPDEPFFGFRELPHPTSAATGMYWSEIHPPALGDFLLRLAREWPVPGIYITENGLPLAEEPVVDGIIDDTPRIDYLAAHIDQVGRAIRGGAPVRGYFAWSLFDTFEWNYGYRPRFGLVRIVRPSLERLPKASAVWYREVRRT
jgi:beta-glucosidase